MNKLRLWLSTLQGRRKYAAAAALGALMTLAMPPVGAFYLLLLCVPGLVWLTQNAVTKRDAFLTGWAFGAGFFILGLYWISAAMFVDIAQFWWVVPLSLVVGPAVYALCYGLIPLLARRWRDNDEAYALALVAAWALVEWLRGHALTGFPWNLIGYTWHTFLPMMQGAAMFGIYGLTLLTLLWAAMPAQKKLLPLVMFSFVLAGGGGLVRLASHPMVETAYNVRIVQPNIPQEFKWDRDAYNRNMDQYMTLTSEPGEIAFVVWPETAAMGDLAASGQARAIADSLPAGAIGLLGNLRTTADGRYYNSVVALNKNAQQVAVYDKHHLVPFGEYIPFRRWVNMTPIANGVAAIGDFTRGDGAATLPLAGLPKPSPLICYEAIFPGAVTGDTRPDWLVNVTNDGWYGETAGPHQHFEIARMRAVEEGLPLARAANTGISAMIDPVGRIIGIKRLGETGTLDTPLPEPLPPTLYARLGDLPFFVMLAGVFGLAEALRRRKITG